MSDDYSKRHCICKYLWGEVAACCRHPPARWWLWPLCASIRHNTFPLFIIHTASPFTKKDQKPVSDTEIHSISGNPGVSVAPSSIFFGLTILTCSLGHRVLPRLWDCNPSSPVTSTALKLSLCLPHSCILPSWARDRQSTCIIIFYQAFNVLPGSLAFPFLHQVIWLLSVLAWSTVTASVKANRIFLCRQ